MSEKKKKKNLLKIFAGGIKKGIKAHPLVKATSSVKKTVGNQITKTNKTRKEINKTRKAVKAIDEKIAKKSDSSGKTRAQRMALERKKAKLTGTYKKPKTAQELAKERIEAKKKANKPKKNRRGRRIK